MTKGRLFLIHWNKSEADDFASALRKEGWEVDLEWEDGARGGAAIKLNPPTAVIFYLSRLPSHSRATAEYLAQTKATRHVPLIFVGGDGEALEKTKQKVPTGLYVRPDYLIQTLARIASKK